MLLFIMPITIQATPSMSQVNQQMSRRLAAIRGRMHGEVLIYYSDSRIHFEFL
jgi:hypothetical protein